MNNFELSTYILHQVFPLLNGRDHQDLVTTPIQVWFNEAGELTFASTKGPIGPKWGEPTFTIRLTTKKIQKAFTESSSLKDEERLLDALVMSVFNEIHSKVDLLPLSAQQRKGLTRSIEDVREDIEHLIHSLHMTTNGDVNKREELH